MEKSPRSESSYLVRPGDRDILIGRGHNMYNFIGNRRFRRLVDMFIQEYVDSKSRSFKTGLVRTVIDIALAAGYRFLKRDKRGIFAEITYSATKMKVGHSLRDRSGLVQKHLDLNLKTRSQLKREGIAIMDYVEMVTPVGQRREVITEWAYARTREGMGPSRQAQGRRDTKDRTSAMTCPNHDAIGASCLLQLSSGRPEVSGAKRAAEVMDSEDSLAEDASRNCKKPRFSTETEQAAEKTAASVLVNGFFQNGSECEGNESLEITHPPANKEPSKRYVRFLHDIVVPTLQEGHDALPVAGGWKFFPLPQYRNKKVDLGTQPAGWQLRLVPMSFQADSIMLEVPTAFVRNGRVKRKVNETV
ncbi:hypothetical protein MHU86_16156 [Fragilaria crotonensis]|nr:hypothetical protein MHU86_16156 [Fragilaria crotonensis]